jgi:hypothetical protein
MLPQKSTCEFNICDDTKKWKGNENECGLKTECQKNVNYQFDNCDNV